MAITGAAGRPHQDPWTPGQSTGAACVLTACVTDRAVLSDCDERRKKTKQQEPQTRFIQGESSNEPTTRLGFVGVFFEVPLKLARAKPQAGPNRTSGSPATGAGTSPALSALPARRPQLRRLEQQASQGSGTPGVRRPPGSEGPPNKRQVWGRVWWGDPPGQAQVCRETRTPGAGGCGGASEGSEKAEKGARGPGRLARTRTWGLRLRGPALGSGADARGGTGEGGAGRRREETRVPGQLLH